MFQVLIQTPGIAGDRQNVGGTHDGQQTGMFSRKVLPSFDMFNLFNANTVMGRRANQNAGNANQVFGILAPRIARIGMMVTF